MAEGTEVKQGQLGVAGLNVVALELDPENDVDLYVCAAGALVPRPYARLPKGCMLLVVHPESAVHLRPLVKQGVGRLIQPASSIPT